LKKEAIAAIGAGDYGRAETLRQRIFDTALAAAQRAQEATDKRFLAAAKAKGDLGELKLAELQYAAAAEDFRRAAALVPATEPLIKAEYLNRLGEVARQAGNFALAGSTLTEALSIREGKLNPEHPDIAAALNSHAELLLVTNRHSEAEPLLRRAITIDEK